VIGPGLVWIGEYVSAESATPSMSAYENHGGYTADYVAQALIGNRTNGLGFEVTGVTGSTPPGTFPSGVPFVIIVPVVQFHT
jgi:hypothetical protein